ncbi:MAG: hypothetical protein R3B48_21525 [Kofleriaceae bacterium]
MSGEPTEKLSFLATTDAERDMLLYEGAGTTELLLGLVGLLSRPGQRCPTVVESGTSRTLKGGCTDEDGETWRGTLVVENVVGATNPAKPVRLRYSDFGVLALSVNGTLTVAADIESDVEIRADEGVVRVAAAWQVAGEDTVVRSSSKLTLVGEGYVNLSGRWGSSSSRGFMELRGEQVLALDFGRRDSQGCYATTLDGVPAPSFCAALVTAPTSLGGKLRASPLDRGLIHAVVDAVAR